MSWQKFFDWKRNVAGLLLGIPVIVAMYWTHYVMGIDYTWVWNIWSYDYLWLLSIPILLEVLTYLINNKRLPRLRLSWKLVSWINLFKVVIIPVGEELMFRWQLIIPLTLIAALFMSVPTAIVIGMVCSAVIFGVIHFEQGAWAVIVALGGAVVLMVIALVGGLPLAILAHVLHNLHAVCVNGPDG